MMSLCHSVIPLRMIRKKWNKQKKAKKKRIGLVTLQ